MTVLVWISHVWVKFSSIFCYHQTTILARYKLNRSFNMQTWELRNKPTEQKCSYSLSQQSGNGCSASIYLFKVINRNTKIMRLIWSKLTIKTPGDVVPVSLLLTLNIFHTFLNISIVEFERVSWVSCKRCWCQKKRFWKCPRLLNTVKVQ